MKGHWQDQIRVGKQLLAGVMHPTRKQRHTLEPATPLEPQDQTCATRVVAQRRSGSIEVW
jgi:hypothetical protein